MPADTFQYARGRGLNIGLIAMGWPPDVGGVPSHTADLAREFIARGHQVYVLCLDTRGELEPLSTFDSDVDGVEVRRVAYAYGDHAKLADLMVHDGLRNVILGWMAETPCDLIHVHHVTGFGASALHAVHDVGQPLALTLHDYWLLDPRGQLFGSDGHARDANDLEGLTADIASSWKHLLPSGGGAAVGPLGETLTDDLAAVRAHREYALGALALPGLLVAPSEAARAVYESAGVQKGRIRVVENGVEAEDLAAEVARLRAAAPPRPADEPLRLGLFGTTLPSKGAAELAEAFVEADLPNLRLVIAGNRPSFHGDNSYVERLEALAAAHDSIELRPEYARSELAALLAEVDGVAAPSRWEEVYGLTVREARAAGLPVLVSDRGALPAVAEGGRAGLVVPADDRAAWVDALRRFAADDAARATWGSHESSLRTASQMAAELEGLYLDLVEESTGIRPDLRRSEPDGGDAEPAAPSAPEQPAKRGFLGRLFGR
ncbi:glycosyltransferase [Engelhardtia mirabilis]|uniref:D-inositol 3-phosphate glycosyltransferase n=1 Tax=Engelhardtia mirabilis TaxID=2528011 RepID=A0A518BIH7_9BACT|nr:D-inositol 3-phosphate glycosyltransferase [Planctomycetes bacterium Pla133]QDV01098.1 D-inositol 3-phosphate glycosyltransferase [Planctomycetes bacterium Pla86]